MLLRFACLALLISVIEIFSLDPQCPEVFPEECICNDRYGGIYVHCLTSGMETWDIKATFDEIAEAINDNETIIETIQFDALLLGHSQEVPAHSVSSLKALYLSINAFSMLTRIDPAAFSGSHDTVTDLSISSMHFQNSQDAFDLINNFKQLNSLSLLSNNTLFHIPSHAFDTNLQNLTTVIITYSKVTSIGDYAFDEHPNLDTVMLGHNNLTLDNISDTAFEFMLHGEVIVDLKYNPGITYLPQEKFGKFLTEGNAIFVGTGYIDGDPSDNLYCDNRMDWFCDTNITSVLGYECKETEYVDIFNYCTQNRGYSPKSNKNIEHLKKVELAIRRRHQTTRNEHKLRYNGRANGKKEINT